MDIDYSSDDGGNASSGDEVEKTKKTNDASNKKESWGLISGALGNAKNRYSFFQGLLEGKRGIYDYLKVLAGGSMKNRTNYPVNKNSYLFWEQAKRKFLDAQKRCKEKIAEVVKYQEDVGDVDVLYKRTDELTTDIKMTQDEIRYTEERILDAESDRERSGNGNLMERTLEDINCYSGRVAINLRAGELNLCRENILKSILSRPFFLGVMIFFGMLKAKKYLESRNELEREWEKKYEAFSDMAHQEKNKLLKLFEESEECLNDYVNDEVARIAKYEGAEEYQKRMESVNRVANLKNELKKLSLQDVLSRVVSAKDNAASRIEFRSIFSIIFSSLFGLGSLLDHYDLKFEESCEQLRSFYVKKYEDLGVAISSNKKDLKMIAHNAYDEIIRALNKKCDAYRDKLKGAEEELSSYSNLREYVEKFGGSDNFINDATFRKDFESINILSPWYSEGLAKVRAELFVASMQLHHAFVEGAAEEVKKNLHALRQISSYTIMQDDDEFISNIPDLWSTLALVVPVISSTFASIRKMFVHVPPDTIGWLMIDESGQATPQAALGAIMRSKRVVITGDPMQVEPVVPVSDKLTSRICVEFGMDPKRFNPPTASAQTLGDSVSHYFSQVDENKNIEVGFPLLVHRRCTDPMFSISNKIAYNNLMINQKQQGESKIRECLEDSCWFHVEGKASGAPDEKWCQMEGEVIIQKLEKLKEQKINPDIYISFPHSLTLHEE